MDAMRRHARAARHCRDCYPTSAQTSTLKPKAVSQGNKAGSWNITQPLAPRTLDLNTIRSPITLTFIRGRSSPAMMSSKVDLPQPDAPTRQTTSRSATSSETEASACTSRWRERKHFETFSTTSFGCGLAGVLGLCPGQEGLIGHGASTSLPRSGALRRKPTFFAAATNDWKAASETVLVIVKRDKARAVSSAENSAWNSALSSSRTVRCASCGWALIQSVSS